MPYKSKAQAKKFRVMEAAGELPKGTASEWAHATPSIKALPEHVKGKKKMKKSAEFSPAVKQAALKQLVALAVDDYCDNLPHTKQAAVRVLQGTILGMPTLMQGLEQAFTGDRQKQAAVLDVLTKMAAQFYRKAALALPDRVTEAGRTIAEKARSGAHAAAQSVSKATSPKPNLAHIGIAGAAGATVGGVGGYLLGKRKKEEEGEKSAKSMLLPMKFEQGSGKRESFSTLSAGDKTPVTGPSMNPPKCAATKEADIKAKLMSLLTPLLRQGKRGLNRVRLNPSLSHLGKVIQENNVGVIRRPQPASAAAAAKFHMPGARPVLSGGPGEQVLSTLARETGHPDAYVDRMREAASLPLHKQLLGPTLDNPSNLGIAAQSAGAAGAGAAGIYGGEKALEALNGPKSEHPGRVAAAGGVGAGIMPMIARLAGRKLKVAMDAMGGVPASGGGAPAAAPAPAAGMSTAPAVQGPQSFSGTPVEGMNAMSKMGQAFVLGRICGLR